MLKLQDKYEMHWMHQSVYWKHIYILADSCWAYLAFRSNTFLDKIIPVGS